MEDNIPPADNNDEVNAIANANNPSDIAATDVHNLKTSSDFISSLITIQRNVSRRAISSTVRDAAENGLCVAPVDAAENDESCADVLLLAHSLMSWGSGIMGGESDEDDVGLVVGL